MRVTTRFTIDMNSGEILEWNWYDYTGPVAEAKKGRGQTTAAANNALGTTATDTAAQNNARSQAQPFVNNLLSTKPGQLSPYAQSQYESDVRNIRGTYDQLAQSGLKGIGYQGWNNAPSGMEASVKNSAIRDEGAAETGAYNTAQQNTLGQGLAGIGYLQNQQSIYDPTKAENATTQAGLARSQEGSTLGDIGQGLTTVSNAFGNVFQPVKFPGT